MNQEDDTAVIDAKLLNRDGVDILKIIINGNTHNLDLNADNNQDDIKKMFCDLVVLVEVKPVKIALEIEDDFDNPLLVEVSKSYISDLNEELELVRTKLVDE